jgi:hypothetical protein
MMPSALALTRSPPDLAVRVMIALAFAGLAVPPLLVAIPPLVDYPNHLVRMWLLAGGARIAPLSEMFAPAWDSARTNVGIDYAAALLGGLAPAEAIGQAVVLLAVLLPALGAAALNRALYGGWHWWQMAPAFLAWNATLMAGFINFQIGIGLALLSAAAEPRLARGGALSAAVVRLGLGIAVMTVHLFALAFYAALIAGCALGREPIGRSDWRALGGRARAALLGALPAVAALLPLLLLARALPGAHVAAVDTGPVWDFSAYNKIRALIAPISTYSWKLDVALAAAMAAPAVAALLMARLAAHAGLTLVGLGLLAAGFAAPAALAGTWWIDSRFPVMGALVLAAAVRPEPLASHRAALSLAALLISVVTVRTALVATHWRAAEADIAAVRRAVASVEPGAAILPLDHGAPGVQPTRFPAGRYFHLGQPAHWYYPLLAVKWQRAFVPILYWAPGKQPIRVLPPWSEISFPESGLSASIRLVEPDVESAYFRDWRRRFDYVLLLNADVGRGMDITTLPEISLVRDEGFARLYRIAPHRKGPDN